MSYQITGTIKRISDTEHVGAKQHPKRELWLEHGDEYPQVSAFEFFGEKNAPKLDGLEVGQSVTVHFDLRGREWDGGKGPRVFNSLSAWRVEHPAEAMVRNTFDVPADDDTPF